MYAFCVLTFKNMVFALGKETWGGNIGKVQYLVNVNSIIPFRDGFYAKRFNGTCIEW